MAGFSPTFVLMVAISLIVLALSVFSFNRQREINAELVSAIRRADQIASAVPGRQEALEEIQRQLSAVEKLKAEIMRLQEEKKRREATFKALSPGITDTATVYGMAILTVRKRAVSEVLPAVTLRTGTQLPAGFVLSQVNDEQLQVSHASGLKRIPVHEWPDEWLERFKPGYPTLLVRLARGEIDANAFEKARQALARPKRSSLNPTASAKAGDAPGRLDREGVELRVNTLKADLEKMEVEINRVSYRASEYYYLMVNASSEEQRKNWQRQAQELDDKLRTLKESGESKKTELSRLQRQLREMP